MTNLPPKILSKRRVAALLVTLVVAMGLAGAQSSKPLASSTKSSATSLQSANKPITPKSAMSAPHKAAPVAPNRTSKNTNAELSQLERGQGTGVPRSSSTAKVAPVKSQSNGPTPKIDYKYQKPAGGKGPSTSIH